MNIGIDDVNCKYAFYCSILEVPEEFCEFGADRAWIGVSSHLEVGVRLQDNVIRSIVFR